MSLLNTIAGVAATTSLPEFAVSVIVGISIVYSTPYKRFLLGIDAIILVVLYVLLMISLYHL